jgi:tetratricopeptide (TPR) repeat protein
LKFGRLKISTLNIKFSIMNLDEMEDQAVLLLDGNKLRRAEHVLKQMIIDVPNCLPAHFHLARVYRRTEEYDRALYHARYTLKLSPTEPNACLNLGLIYELLGRDERAKFYYKKELSRNPANAETLWNIGRLYFKGHRWLDASKYLRACFETSFKFEMEDTIYKLGFCYYKLRDLKSYIEVFASYVRINPNAAWAFANLGHALLDAKDYKGAVLRLSRASQLGVKKNIAVELARARELLRMESGTRNRN